MNIYARSGKHLWPLIFCIPALLLLLNACGLSPSLTSANNTPQPTPTAAPTATAAPGTPQVTQQYEFTEQDSGKTLTYTITSRFSIVLNTQKYPKSQLQLSCQPVGTLGTITNLPYEAPPLYAVRYEGVQEGICTIKNGSFLLTVKIIY